MNSVLKPKRLSPFHRLPVVLGLLTSVLCGVTTRAQAEIVLDFNDVPSGTLLVFNPYVSQGFALTSTSGGFVFNSADTGNGSPQTVGNNPFYAGSNGLAAFAPATITLTQDNGKPFSLSSIDLARNFAFDPAPSVTFTGVLSGGGTVSETFIVTHPSPPLDFQTFDFTGFNDIIAVSWDQATFNLGLHQFGNIHLDPAGGANVPEPGSLAFLTALAVPGGYLAIRRHRRR